MGFSSLSGHARTNASSPRSHAICDRCGARYNHDDLRWQYEWRGTSLQNIRLLVCRSCEDVPQQQLMAFAVPADPIPIKDPRIQDFYSASDDIRTTSGQNTVDFFTGITIPGNVQRVTTSGGNATTDPRVTQEIGKTGGTEIPPGLDAGAAMPLFGKKAYDVKLTVTSITASGSPVLTVTCSTAHGLSTNNQISVEGSALSTTDGFYSVTVIDALTFTYTIASTPVGITSFLLPSTIVKTVLVGIPRGQITIPQVGG